MYVCSLYLWLYSMHSQFFFFNDTATTEIYTLSLHDALPICDGEILATNVPGLNVTVIPNDISREKVGELAEVLGADPKAVQERSEEHTSELQSRQYLVCRLLLEKKKNKHARQSQHLPD